MYERSLTLINVYSHQLHFPYVFTWGYPVGNTREYFSSVLFCIVEMEAE